MPTQITPSSRDPAPWSTSAMCGHLGHCSREAQPSDSPFKVGCGESALANADTGCRPPVCRGNVSVSPPWPPHGLSSNSRPDKASTVLRILQANGQATCVEVSRDRARYFTCPGRRNCFCRRSSPLVPHSVQHPTNSPSRVVSRADAARPPDSSGMRRRHAHHDSTTCSLPT